MSRLPAARTAQWRHIAENKNKMSYVPNSTLTLTQPLTLTPTLNAELCFSLFGVTFSGVLGSPNRHPPYLHEVSVTCMQPQCQLDKSAVRYCSYILYVVWSMIGLLSHGYASFYRAMHCSAKRGIAIACLPSVCPSVCDVGGPGSHRLEILETNCTDN